MNPYEYKPPVSTEGSSTSAQRQLAPRRALELTIGLVAMAFGLSMAGLAALPLVRAIQSGRLRHYLPGAFEVALFVIAVPLLVIAWRLIRGHGVNYGPRLMSPIGMSLAGFALLLCSVALVWGGVEIGGWFFWSTAVLCAALTGLAFRSAWEGLRLSYRRVAVRRSAQPPAEP